MDRVIRRLTPDFQYLQALVRRARRLGDRILELRRRAGNGRA